MAWINVAQLTQDEVEKYIENLDLAKENMKCCWQSAEV